MTGCSPICCKKPKESEPKCEESCDKSNKPSDGQAMDENVLSPKSTTMDMEDSDYGAQLQAAYKRHIENAPCLEPYIFRMAGMKGLMNPDDSPIGVKSPPFAIIFDHTLATVWCLCSKNKEDQKKLGVAQLQWALYFLKTLNIDNGKYTPDVNLVMSAIEDLLIEKYADISEAAMKTKAEKDCCRCAIIGKFRKPPCDICSVTKLAYEPRKPETLQKKSEKDKASEKTPKKKTPVRVLKKPTGESAFRPAPEITVASPNEDEWVTVHPSFPHTSQVPQRTPQVQTPQQQEQFRIVDKPTYIQKLFMSLPTDSLASSFGQSGFSGTTLPGATSTPYEDRLTVRDEIKHLKNLASSFNKSEGPSSPFAEMLQSWRDEQKEKIKMEMDRLKSIEALLANEDF